MTAPALQVAVQGITPVSADNFNTYEQTCNTAADLQAFIGTPGIQVFLRGLSAINDGGQGAFYWNANGSANDGVNNIQPSGAAAGTWTRITSAAPSLIYCTATGTNTVTLTPATPVGEYENGQLFGFVAAQTSTGSITLGVGSLSAVPVYLPNGLQAGAGSFQSGIFYIVAYVPSYNSNAGGFALVSSQNQQEPTRTVLTSGTGTYTTPTACTRLEIRMMGGGGGGGGAGSGSSAGGNGGTTTFSGFSALGGSGASNTGGGAGSAGGTASGGSLNLVGAVGSPGALVAAGGGSGGSGPFGGAGAGAAAGGANNGGAAQTNTGAGGGGSATASASTPGGSCGGYLEGTITSPSATYTYAVGAGGTAGTAGSGGGAGGAGGSGVIIIDEYYD